MWPRPRAQTEWERPSFMRELFLGNFRLDLVHPFPLPRRRASRVRRLLRRAVRAFLRDEVDPAEIDRTGEYPRARRRRPAQASAPSA